MVRRIISSILVSMLVVSTSLGAEGTFPHSEIPSNNFSLTDYFKINSSSSVTTEACKTADSLGFFTSKSQSSLMGLFKKNECSELGKFTSSNELDNRNCTAIDQCIGQDGNNLISDDQKHFLASEIEDFFYREITQEEMGKYYSDKTNEFLLIMSTSSNMPEEYRNQILKCDDAPKVNKNICDNNSDASKLVQTYIKDEVYGKVLGRTLQMAYKNFSSLSPFSDADVGPVSVVAPMKGKDFSHIYQSMQENERKDESLRRDSSPKFSVDHDRMVDFLIAQVEKENIDTLSSDKLDAIISKSFLEGKESHDVNFFRADENLRDIVKKNFLGIKFTKEDFKKEGRNSLFDKVSKIRVMYFNSHVKEDCAQVNTTIAQTCANISSRLENQTALDIFNKYKNDPFKKIIEYYKTSNEAEKDKKIESFEKMQSAPFDVFQKYLALSLKSNACMSKNLISSKKESDKKDEDKKISDAIGKRLKERESSTEANREKTIEALTEAAKYNDSLRNELQALDIKPKSDSTKTNSAVTGIVENKAPAVDNSALSHVDNSVKAAYQLDRPVRAPKINASSNQFVDSSFDSLAAPTSKGKDLSDLENQLMAKQAELNKREKALAEKTLSNSNDNQSDKKDLKEDETKTSLLSDIQDLQKQISELKKTPAETAQAAVSEATEPTSASQFSSAIKSYGHDDYVQSDIPAMVPKTVTENFTEVEGENAALPSRGIASIGQASATSSAAIKGSGNKETGIVLTKSGEVLQDPSAILDNPKENDIANLFEVTNGKPFLIREKGVLMKVIKEMDEEGNPIIKKIVLTKNQQIAYLKDAADIQREMKEVGSTSPTRLMDLNSLIKDKVK